MRTPESTGGLDMLEKDIFNIDMTLGYLAWALCIATYVWPRLRAMDRVGAHRAIATLNSFRFFGLVFLLPGFVGPNLPQAFAAPAAYGDLATGMLAILALLKVRALSVHLPSVAGQLGAGYAIPMLYVPALFWMHLLAFWLLLRPAPNAVRS